MVMGHCLNGRSRPITQGQFSYHLTYRWFDLYTRPTETKRAGINDWGWLRRIPSLFWLDRSGNTRRLAGYHYSFDKDRVTPHFILVRSKERTPYLRRRVYRHPIPPA